MIKCEHKSISNGREICSVASSWADELPAATTEAACKVCQSCSSPMSLNRVTVSLGQSTLRKLSPERCKQREPESIQYLVEKSTAGESVKRFVSSTVEWIKQGRPERSDAEVKEILKICNACQHWSNHSCDLCGCNIGESGGWTNKARRATEHCPEGHW